MIRANEWVMGAVVVAVIALIWGGSLVVAWQSAYTKAERDIAWAALHETVRESGPAGRSEDGREQSSQQSPRQPAYVVRAETLVAEVELAYRVPRERALRLAEPLVRAAYDEGVPVELFAAVVMTESSFREQVESHAGAIGPAQVVPRWWEDNLCAEFDLLSPDENLQCGARILAHYREMCDGSWVCALHYYNVGPGAIQREENGSLEAAARYEGKVLGYLNTLTAAYWD